MLQRFSLLLILICFGKNSFSQDLTDTIYFDNNWAICEKEAASYYRVGMLRIKGIAFYVGETTDHFMNGQLQMKATYDDNGNLQGNASIYYENGKKKAEGNFTNGIMTGNWNYYDGSGALLLTLNCINEHNFSPVTIISPAGDTLLHQATGKFSLIAGDYPEIFGSHNNYRLKGEVLDGRRKGVWRYELVPAKAPSVVMMEEVYENGVLKSSVGNPQMAKPMRFYNKEADFIHLLPGKFLALDNLSADYIFDRPNKPRALLASFLIEKKRPFFESISTSEANNMITYIQVLSNALRKNMDFEKAAHAIPVDEFSEDKFELFFFGKTQSSPNVEASIRFNILPEGPPANIVVEGNLDPSMKTIIQYYFSRITKLHPPSGKNGHTTELLLKTNMVDGKKVITLINKG